MTYETKPAINSTKAKTLKRKRRLDETKQVRFSTVTEHTFRVSMGACVVPSGQVPGVGLMGLPIQSSIKSVRPDGPGCVMMYSSKDRLHLIQQAGVDTTHLANEFLELKRIQVSRTSDALEHLALKRRQAAQVKETRAKMEMQRLLS
ncbi:Aste57867_19920 [Aphanomyces stellatus]|uniref:Aste57867_19920 protein n=1 Tax=Aphanomyces stellatus TaxID=120398 RepID=A0A485LDT0_9STRA|nr:hypothetical protein As57867_019854 [Aphanomyces stellatus]VFT96618.1 Aste57867_19920 [Aphanomyces stellatus]